MAESKAQKAKRYLRGDFTPTEYRNIFGYLLFEKAIDLATYGKLNNLQGRAFTAAGKALLRAAIPAVSTGGRLAGQAAIGTARVLGSSAVGGLVGAATPIVQSPAFGPAAGLALGYGALQTDPGQQLLEIAAERGRMDRIRFEQALTDISVGVKKKKSKFNTAVSRGMSAAKAGTSYGVKGVINAPKKAFAAVTKLASKINKAKKDKRRFPKAPKTPNAKKIYNSILKVLK